MSHLEEILVPSLLSGAEADAIQKQGLRSRRKWRSEGLRSEQGGKSIREQADTGASGVSTGPVETVTQVLICGSFRNCAQR